MPYIDVDFELEDFDISDILNELKDMFKRIGKREISENQRKEVIESINAVIDSGISVPKIRTLDDQMKFDHFFSVFEKYTVSQIENLLP